MRKIFEKLYRVSIDRVADKNEKSQFSVEKKRLKSYFGIYRKFRKFTLATAQKSCPPVAFASCMSETWGSETTRVLDVSRNSTCAVIPSPFSIFSNTKST